MRPEPAVARAALARRPAGAGGRPARRPAVPPGGRTAVRAGVLMSAMVVSLTAP
ncbi:hypothetical protein STXM2123_623 [Streptomyces sp. F-3]|uniref:Uncharacterized protein n=1 Tax=Streptomyces thermogriseus TaxID=75292 RepID=A0ABP4DHV7_9ACTN|nr:hypothetical protein STXM2123_623 [Streptomyces sp. F-3]